MLIKEYRVVMNCTEAEYQVGQLYAVAEQSKEETGADGDGVKIEKNEPYDDPDKGKGQYTYKTYYLTKAVRGGLEWLSLLQNQ
ncbi:phosphatidylinositol transfer protein [Syncephalis pseudoplumigaleata]|uniref:Phosphatidylinositol transfer protein n=1 Tax=Syncephalis pseudoplumigaleata TaxID=1712513 RepID=A0A4P9YX06_9FUNG|nr:phosphatidylinositol transfer protein [Syncephalis pseudoplumigaleata]|eukprot:RKP24032.1 phosphatidylinositol transfer protein [Syncephalis pseudoplumigaleata]